MTTIATDGVTIAADGLRCSGDEPLSYAERKLVVDSGVIYAFMGDFAAMPAAIAWHKAGADPREAPRHWDGPDGGWTLIVIERGPKCTLYRSRLPYPDPHPFPQAFGSGCNFAMGALLAGASPRNAIEVASRLNVYTGGEIQVVNIAEALAGGTGLVEMECLKYGNGDLAGAEIKIAAE